MSISAVPDPPPDRESREPAMKVAGYTAIGTFATALIGTLVAFGVDMSPVQQAAVLGLVGAALAVAPLVSGWFTRGEVYAPATVAVMKDKADRLLADANRRLDDATSQPGRDSSRRWPEEMQ
jgi:hypothetical protein